MSYDLSIVQLRETAAQFRASLPVPSASQLCIEVDTGRAFSGDGATVITALQDLKLTGEERRDADLAWLGMQLSDDRDEVGSGGGGGGGTIEHDPFGYSATTNPSGIGIGEVRFNSTTFASITKMYVSDNDQNAVDLVAEQSIMTSGVAKLYKAGGGKLSFQVTRMVDQSGYFEYDVAPLSGTMPTVGEVCYVDFVPDAPGVRAGIFDTSQSGTDAPVLVAAKSSLAAAPTATYIGAGQYELAGDFPVGKTVCFCTVPYDANLGWSCSVQVTGLNTISIQTFANDVASDDTMSSEQHIYITVLP